MLAAFDASGNKTDQTILLVAGFVSSVEQWMDFDRDWRKRLEDDGIEYFHATEFAHSRGAFEGWKN